MALMASLPVLMCYKLLFKRKYANKFIIQLLQINVYMQSFVKIEFILQGYKKLFPPTTQTSLHTNFFEHISPNLIYYCMNVIYISSK